MSHHGVGRCLGLTWQTRGQSLSSEVLTNPCSALCMSKVVFSGMIQGLFGSVLPMTQWKTENSLDSLPTMSWNQKNSCKSHLICLSCELRCSMVTWCKLTLTWQLTYPGLTFTCHLTYPGWQHCSGTHLCVQLTANATSCIFEHAETFFCGGVFWGWIFLCL